MSIPEVIREYHPNRSLKSVYTVVDGKKNGEYNEYLPSNKSFCTTDYEHDQLLFCCMYVDDKKNGVYTEYYKDNGNLAYSCMYVDDKKNGEYKAYSKYIPDALAYTCMYVDDKKNGEYKEYYDCGKQLKFIRYYVDDKKNGEETEFYWHTYSITRFDYWTNKEYIAQDGRYRYRVFNYIDGERDNEYKIYELNGELCEICTFIVNVPDPVDNNVHDPVVNNLADYSQQEPDEGIED
jgi:antitoxin component YwqK of YwqJK toxin-antitoxin module